MGEQGRLLQKERFFDKLVALDDDEDDQPLDHGRRASENMLKSSRPNKLPSHSLVSHSRVSSTFSGTPSPRRAPHLREARPTFSRTLSAPAPTPSTADAQIEPYSVPNTPLKFASSPVQPASRTTMPSEPAKPTLAELAQIPRAPGRRKKDCKVKLVPEGNRVFKDLVFYFFPNNDTNSGRRMRITKALEYGATWVVEWCDQVTHVVVDRSIQYDQMKSYLKFDTFPEAVTIVNERYPADCITYRSLIDPKQPHYQVQGHTVVQEKPSVEEPRSSDRPSPQPPQLKPTNEGEITTELTQSSSPHDGGNEGGQQSLPAPLPERKEGNAHGSSNPSSGIYNDVLEEIISGTKHTEYLPLDIEDEEPSPQSSDLEDEGTDTEDERPKKVAKKSFDQQAGPTKEQFQCMKKHDGKTKDTDRNARTIEILTEMGNYYEQIKDEWRSRAYRKAISTLRKQDRKIMTKEEAFKLPFIGNRLAAKIEEIVWTDRLRRLDNTRHEPGDEALQTFLKIYGVGLSKATKWVMRGLRTLEDLSTHNIQLTTTQEVGLAHYSDFNSRIPRAEVSQHAVIVQSTLKTIDPNFTATVGGSYRRGATTSGDIDILISCPNVDLTRLQAVVFDELVPQLTDTGFLKVALASHTHGDSDRGTKWHGASALPATTPAGKETWRRIDLLLVPYTQLGAALIYFTGNDIFNRSIRLLASRKGMRLNQRGLYRDVLRGRGRQKITEGELVEGMDEKRIFEVLGVPWRPPEHRIC